MALARYSRVLQDRLNLTDDRWEYTIRDLPRATDSNPAGFMKSCCLSASSTKQDIVLSFTKIPSNRAIVAKPLNALIHLTCPEFRLHTEDGIPATSRDSADYIANFLKSGLVLNGVRYSFYGHSNSQLKSRSCILMAGSQGQVDEEVERLGDFSKMKTVAKKAKRIGLLFSTAHAVLRVDPSRCRDVADIERDEYIFTDGCGNISPSLARLLAQKKPILFRNKRYHPSVFQIRYRGYKGVVLLEPKLEPAVWLEFRKSMRKFSGGQDYSFAVVEFSKPYTYGYLNDEIVLLLHALGIDRDVLERKQDEHLDFLEMAVKDPRFAFRFLSSIGSMELAERVILEGIEVVEKQLQRLVAQEHGKLLNKRNIPKCRILVPQSRLLFGVCDAREVLQEGECFIQPTSDEDGIPHTLTGSYVLVARNPCLHPGDLQKLRVVAKPELAHLVDCIVFPTKGRRPAADMMSGGDLDGDTFFVSWDKDLVPASISQPAEYPGAKEPIQFAAITAHHRIDYFARSSSMQLGQIKNLFLKWARIKGPLSSDCQELNRLFSQCVDASRVRIPDRLKNLPESANPPEFILDILHASAKRRVQAYKRPSLVERALSEDDLLALLAEPAGMSQFELAQLTLRWCQSYHTRFEDYWQFFDHTQLSSEEKAWFISQLPARYDVPETVSNDLMHSEILTPSELRAIGLQDARTKWRRVYNSASDRLANFLEMLCRTFPFITRKLLVLRIHERLSVAIYLPMKIDPVDEVVVGRCGRLFAFPHSKDDVTSCRVIVPTKHDARFYYDHQGFQLYESKRANTFVYLARAANDDSKYRHIKGVGSKARARQQTVQEGINQEWTASIALNKFSQGLATHVGRVWREGVSAAEVYIISNTDTRSFQHLDLWLEQIDTDTVHRNFERGEEEVSPSVGISDVDWETETEAVTAIVRDHKLGNLERVTSVEIARALELSWRTHSQEIASGIFSTWMRHLRTARPSVRRDEITSRLIDFLTFMPGLVIHFVRLSPWTDLEASLRSQLVDCTLHLVKTLVACLNKMGRLAASHMATLLSEISELPTDGLKEIIQMVALKISSTETALDAMAEVMEPMTSRLLLITPRNSQYLMNRLSAIAINHIEEAADSVKNSRANPYQWKFGHPVRMEEAEMFLTCDYRIDAPAATRLALGDHVRFRCVQAPANIVLIESAYFEALIDKFEVGQVTLKCLGHPPSFYQQSLWTLEHCGSFVTAQTMIDAVMKLMIEKEACCLVFPNLMASQPRDQVPLAYPAPISDLSNLNPSQRSAVMESLTGSLTCIWGPPGTGKTYTIVAIINEVLNIDKEKRMLVTAPTHTAVDNVMRRYLKHSSQNDLSSQVGALRVSTDIHKVSSDLRSYTCDAMLGKDINQSTAARRNAQKKVSQSRLIFTTCIGAGLGLLRKESFDNVIIDEASQQTEPASLVPLVKGCSRAILVGDHVQLRATVQPNAAALEFDISLFERLWTRSDSDNDRACLRKVMLDTQYRMHPSVCAFPSTEFYESALKTASQCAKIAIPLSSFQWPKDDSRRSVFIQVSTAEDLGQKSKSNHGQAKVCHEVVRQLRSPPPATADSPTPEPASYSIAILTPYTRQAGLLKQQVADEKISSIDGFQGQEADVIVYVSVRCNVHGEIGFLRDMRRLNVALTRARAATVIIGDETTLTGGKSRGSSGGQLGSSAGGEEDSHLVWKRLVATCARVEIESCLADPRA